MIEMVVVLLLMGIIAATVLGRAITTSDLDLNSETDKIRNYLRYAQAEAMKRSNTVWGIKSAGNEYWLFRDIKPGQCCQRGQAARGGVFRRQQPHQRGRH